jgi:hypothetical protein
MWIDDILEYDVKKGYDFPDIRELVQEYGYIAHVKIHGEKNKNRDTRF